jgi:hypothetical protein
MIDARRDVRAKKGAQPHASGSVAFEKHVGTAAQGACSQNQAGRQPGGAATRRRGNQAGRQPGRAATRQGGNQAARQPGRAATRRRGNQAARQPGGAATRQGATRVSMNSGPGMCTLAAVRPRLPNLLLLYAAECTFERRAQGSNGE